MNPSPACEALTKTSEGCKLKAYPDPGTGGKPWTIGYGHTGPEVTPGLIWTQAQADKALASDLAAMGRSVSALIGAVPTTQGQFDALTDFAFNVGPENLKNSTLLKKHLARDYAGAADEFGKWIKAAGKVLPGLVTRRAREKALYLSHQQVKS